MRILVFGLLAVFVGLSPTMEGEALAQQSKSKLGILFGTIPEETKSLFAKDDKGNQLGKFNWEKGLPTYVEFLLPAKRYSIDVPGPIRSIEVETSADAQTFVEYTPFTTDNGEQGVEIRSWRGRPSDTITKAISELRNAKAVPSVVKWNPESGNDKIRFSTDPPWPNPFDNPPPRPRK
jgi:hypothetical protein